MANEEEKPVFFFDIDNCVCIRAHDQEFYVLLTYRSAVSKKLVSESSTDFVSTHVNPGTRVAHMMSDLIGK